MEKEARRQVCPNDAKRRKKTSTKKRSNQKSNRLGEQVLGEILTIEKSREGVTQTWGN